MDWNSKFDWGFEEEGIINTGPFHIFESKNSSCGSESVCTESSFKDVMKNSQDVIRKINAFSGNIKNNEKYLQRAEHNESPPPLESSVGSGESLIGLKLGKRMYFENNGFGSSIKSASLPEVHVSSVASNVKKIKSPNLNNPTRCQVEGCNLDLSSAKEYHRKHKVCANHSRSPKVVVGGQERRFCQQCSRFHSLPEFDENKRSCRKRLSDHNARRRKPHIDHMHFNTMSLPSPLSAFTCTDGRRELSLVPNNHPHIYSKSSSNSTWESSFSSKFTNTKSCLLKFEKNGGLDEQLQLSGTQFPLAINLPGQGFNWLLPSTGTKSENFTQGFKESAAPPNMGSAQEFHRALSLLSNDSWNLFPPQNNSLDHSINANHMHHHHHHQPVIQGFPRINYHSNDSLAASANDTNHFELFKAPYDNALYSNLYN